MSMNSLRRMSYWTVVLAICLGLGACGNRGKTSEQESLNENDTVVATTHENGQKKDSTIYGVSSEFGMSTFTLISKDGDTINVMRTGEDGSDAQIAGDLNEGQYYAMTLRDGGESLSRLVNLTQLRKFTDKFSISNARVVLETAKGNDTVTITRLDDHAFTAKGKLGTYNYR